MGIKKAEDTICIKFTYICIHMPGQKIQQFTFPHDKRSNGTALCSFGVPFTVLFSFYFFFLIIILKASVSLNLSKSHLYPMIRDQFFSVFVLYLTTSTLSNFFILAGFFENVFIQYYLCIWNIFCLWHSSPTSPFTILDLSITASTALTSFTSAVEQKSRMRKTVMYLGCCYWGNFSGFPLFC